MLDSHLLILPRLARPGETFWLSSAGKENLTCRNQDSTREWINLAWQGYNMAMDPNIPQLVISHHLAS
jgi:hypothetical protein